MRGGIKNNRDFVDGKIFQTVNFGFAPPQMSGLRGAPVDAAVILMLTQEANEALPS